MKRTILAVLMVVMVTTPCLAEELSTLSTELQAALDRAREELDIIGISAAVITPENGLWFGVSGLSHRNPPTSMEPEMLFNLGSITKNFTATLVFQLVEEGLLNLDDTVGDWLSDLPQKYTRWIDDKITIRQLLQHTSGIDDILGNNDLLKSLPTWIAILLAPKKIYEHEDALRFVQRPYAVPGEGFYYSNVNYILLGMIIEKATNSNIAKEFRNRFFDPLGLEKTFMNIEEPLDGEIAHGSIFGIDFSRMPRNALDSIGWTAGAMFSTAEDLVLWTEALFKGDLLSEDSLGQMLDFSVLAEPYKEMEQTVGLGMWNIKHPTFGDIWHHTGWWPFYAALMGYLPDDDIMFVVLVNEFLTADQFDVMEYLLEVVVN